MYEYVCVKCKRSAYGPIVKCPYCGGDLRLNGH